MDESRSDVQNDGLRLLVHGAAVHSRSHGVSGQFAAVCVPHDAVKHRSEYVNSTRAGADPATPACRP